LPVFVNILWAVESVRVLEEEVVVEEVGAGGGGRR
jgi:hypothetical protein